MDKIIEEALSIGQDPARGWDEAAKALAPYRRQYAASDLSDGENLKALTEVVTMQLKCLLKIDKAQNGAEIGAWFHHILHDLPAPNPSTLPRALFREDMARFFCEYARCLCLLERYEDMRLAMRTALDTTRELPMMIVMLVHLYAPLEQKGDIEGEKAAVWLSKRYCECLALLDFSGQSQTAFRATLDDFQAAMRFKENRDSLFQQVISRNDGTDPALDTLTRLFEKHLMTPLS